MTYEDTRLRVIKLLGLEEDTTNVDLLDELMCSTEVQSKIVDEARWWNEVEYVVNIDGVYVRYYGAETTGDRCAEECGYEQSLDGLAIVEPYETIVIDYKEIK
jgi:hypothetical protein